MNNPEDLYLGMMSGTSVDGIDAALVSFSAHRCTVRATHSTAYAASLRRRLKLAAQAPGDTGLDELGALHHATGRAFANAALALLDQSGVDAAQVRAIGSHGQTLLHAPDGESPFSLQVGDAAVIAARTRIATVADFRSGDMAAGGQGAPLAPAFHRWAFADSEADRAVVNLGGIANLTCLPPDGPVTGFDTGPASALLDHWCSMQRGEAFDRDGAWAASGTVQPRLLARLLDDAYLARRPPKSTGVDHYSPAWLQGLLEESEPCAPADVQATLAEFTAASLADAVLKHSQARVIALCGGGAHNADLVRRIAARLPDRQLVSTADWGIPPDWVEACAFAWLAHRRMAGLPSNEGSVTGARAPCSLGAIYLPPGRL